MMNIIQRIKNLWSLSKYHRADYLNNNGKRELVLHIYEDKRLATIIPPEEESQEESKEL